MSNLEETFEYDSQNRLKKVWLGPTLTGASVYDSYGRMTAKTANGQLIFYDAEFGTTAKPHAMDAAATVAENFPQATQTITYTGFDKVAKVKQGNDSLCYTYGYDHQRIFMEEHVENPMSAQGFNRYAYCMNNPLRYVDPSGWLPVGGGGGGYLGSYGYQVTHRANSVYNHYFKTALLSLIQDWQANPSRSTGEALVNAGITNLTVGEVYGSYQGDSGYRNSYYSWTGSNSNAHEAESLYEYVGGNRNGVFSVSNMPLSLYGAMTSLEKANILAQSLGVPMGTISEGMEMAAKSYHNIPLLKAFSGLNKAQKIAAISKEGVGLLKMAKGLGVAGAAVSSGISLYNMGNYYSNGGTENSVWIKTGFDIGIAIFGIIGGPIGLTVCVGYYILDLATDGFGVSYEIKP